MAARFDLCVIFAEMRTGSNHLEAMLDGVPGLRGLGELFNPVFVGTENQEGLFGFDLERREVDPLAFLQAVRGESGPDLPIFRFFHDHDARVLGPILDDPRVAKVILRRNPLDSYISRKIAAETGQWKMTDARSRKSAQVRFEQHEFQTMLEDWSGFSAEVTRGLQTRGQTAFEIGYDDLGDKAVLDGLLAYLGVSGQVEMGASNLKPQNPGGPRSKVENPEEMEAALSGLDPFGLARGAATELGRPVAARSFLVFEDPALMVMPVPGVLHSDLSGWLKAEPKTGLNQRELRQWMRQHPGHQRISIIRHPLARAHDVFCQTILPRRPATAEIRRKLRRRFSIPVPLDWPDPGYDLAAHRAAFTAYLEFLGPCLAGQSSLAPRPDWAGQMASLQGMAGFALPDHVLRADRLEAELSAIGLPPLPGPISNTPFDLSDVVDDAIERLARTVYRRDYVFFGYGDWRDQAA